MAKKMDVVKAYYDLAWTNPPASALKAIETYYADDFKSLDKSGNVVMTKEMLIGMTQLLSAAFKDFKAVYSDLHEEADGVFMKFHFEGTQTGDLDLSAMGLGVVPASGKKIIWPEADTKWLVEGGQITGEKEISGGIAWFLSPLGVKLPTA